MSDYSDIPSDGGMDPRAKYEAERAKEGVRVFTAQGYEYSYPVAFPAQIALALDIRDLLLDIRAGRTTGNPHNAFKP
jgi:hypothetical protein